MRPSLPVTAVESRVTPVYRVGSVAAGNESQQGRNKRRHQRTLFDGIAERYEAFRPGYPEQILEFVATTAGLGPGAAVLEVGCGTGQLTEWLAGAGFRLTAIDIGRSMVAAAQRRLDGAGVCFQVTSFEDLAAADASFALVISGAAFHWIDPEIAFSKSDVIGLASTRATFLSWPCDTQRHFTEELRLLLESQPAVHLTRHTSVTMAPVLADRS
jgi:SAM-dependent methyltransferase